MKRPVGHWQLTAHLLDRWYAQLDRPDPTGHGTLLGYDQGGIRVVAGLITEHDSDPPDATDVALYRQRLGRPVKRVGRWSVGPEDDLLQARLALEDGELHLANSGPPEFSFGLWQQGRDVAPKVQLDAPFIEAPWLASRMLDTLVWPGHGAWLGVPGHLGFLIGEMTRTRVIVQALFALTPGEFDLEVQLLRLPETVRGRVVGLYSDGYMPLGGLLHSLARPPKRRVLLQEAGTELRAIVVYGRELTVMPAEQTAPTWAWAGP